MLFPMSIFNRLTILCAILRHLHLLFIIYVNGELSALKPHAIIVDQLSAGLPLLAYLYPAAPILFYCHFPDLLLARGRESAIKRLYRWPFDALEQWSMTYAHTIAVNSLFTRDVVAKTWPKLIRQVPIRVVYPCVDITPPKEKDLPKVLDGEKVLLSINRFERKKDIGLAIKAFAAVPEAQRKGVRLVIAGN
jgi:alpha-1,3/alpha-1,6-mannosyltransferase